MDNMDSDAPLEVAHNLYDVFLCHHGPDAPLEVAQNLYDVFLCHHGPDAKSTLVDLLRAFFELKGVTCSMDYQMEEGVDFPPTLKQAIGNSKVHIIVLSPRFAESSCCLDAVEEIMQMQKNSKAKTVLPIFFDVEPVHFHHQQSRLAYHLSQLHKGHTKAKIDQWSRTLVDLADINGFIWPRDRSQGQMIEEIVSRVEVLLDCLPIYADSTFASRYADQIKQAEQMLCLNNDDNVVSIGVRGIDKSRFAVELYKKFQQDFPAACILLDIKGKAKFKQGVLKLQMTLFKGLVKVGSVPKIHDTAQGRALLLDCLKHVKCFIVLDDIEDDDEQLRSLLIRDQHRLCRGSRLVLTSHYPHVLDIRAHVTETIHLWHKDIVEEHLAICWESNDVHEGFIDHLNESLSMLGLDVSEVRGVDLLNWAYQKQEGVILVILSRCFVADSILMQGLDEASKLCPKVKVVPIYYGLELGRMGSLQTEIPPSTSHGMLGAMNIAPWLSRSLPERAWQFPVDFENTSRLDMLAFKSLINDIVLNHMQHKYEMVVRTKFPVGLRMWQRKLENQICDIISNRDKVGTYGILGMGGIGKTTLAESLYNRIHKKFEGACFLLNIGTKAKKGGLVSLQRDIATILNKDPISIRNVEEGKAILSHRLRGTHILLILDDVDHVSQLAALFSPLDLGPGSLVVITTRDRSLLESAKVNGTYEMDYLDQKNAKRLFFWHAFLKPFPPSGLKMIAQKVIDACGGLPLSLEVMGACIFDHNDPAYWEDALLHLRKGGNEIFEKLRVSVDALESYQREAFLDVCCFLTRKPFETALRIWEGCGWAGKTCGHVLKSKCLITVDPIDGTIGMHDQIRDMGRYIADGRTNRTHIWDAKDASHIPQGGIEDLRGFAMISQEEKHCEASDLARLCRLKVLLLRNLQIIGGNFSKLRYDQIRWLQWQKSPFGILPPGLYCSRELRVLDLSDSVQLETLWGSSQSGKSEVPDQSLQELNLSGCSNLRELTQFDVYLQNLEWLSLMRCGRLNYLHDSIGSLKKLKSLDLSCCSGLRSLPDTIEGLHSLEKLDLSDCVSLDSLPKGIGRCRNLIEIHLTRTTMTKLPESFGELRNLKFLDLSDCEMRALPDTIEGLFSLEKLHLSGCESLKRLPEGIGRCRNLIEIHLTGTAVTNLPESFGELRNLKFLDLRGCRSMRSLPETIEGLFSLEKLHLSYCESLDSLPEGIGRCRNLIEIHLTGTAVTNLPESFGELRNYKFLDLTFCLSLRSLPETIEGLHSLEKLDLSYCESLDSLPEGIGNCRNLIEINLRRTGVTKLPESFGLHSLEKLDLSYCESLDSLPEGIGRCRNLIEIHLTGTAVTNLPESFGELRNLKFLDLRGCRSMRSLPETIEGLHSLEKLDLSDCVSLDSLPEGIGRCRNLIEIHLRRTAVMNLPESFGELRNLKFLDLFGCRSMRSLPETIEGLHSLEKLDLKGCESLDSLPEGIGRCRNLIEIHLRGTAVMNLPESFSKLRNLKMLKRWSLGI